VAHRLAFSEEPGHSKVQVFGKAEAVNPQVAPHCWQQTVSGD